MEYNKKQEKKIKLHNTYKYSFFLLMILIISNLSLSK